MLEDYEERMFPKVYVGGRVTGKTTLLLKRAASNIPILTHSLLMKGHLCYLAKRMNLNVKVITIEELKRDGRQKPEKVIIDEAQTMLEHLLKARVDALSVTTYALDDLGEEVWSVNKVSELEIPSKGTIKVRRG